MEDLLKIMPSGSKRGDWQNLSPCFGTGTAGDGNQNPRVREVLCEFAT